MPSSFATDARGSAARLRALPGALSRTLDRQVGPTVVRPLAAAIARAWTGPHSRVLSAATRLEDARPPRITVGGNAPRLSGGGRPVDVVWGNEYGGGRRPRTRQFRGLGRRTVERTVERETPAAFQRWSDLVTDTIERETRG